MSEVVNDVVEVNGSEFSEVEFDTYLSSKMRILWTKVESSKNLLRNGQQVVSYEQLQGVSDGLKYLISNVENRLSKNGGITNENASD